MSGTSQPDLNVVPDGAAGASAAGAGVGVGRGSDDGLGVSVRGSAYVVNEADASTAEKDSAASALAAPGVAALEPLSEDFLLLQRHVGLQRATDMKNQHQHWESNVANVQLPFEAVMTHPVVEALAEKADASDIQLQALSQLVQQVQPLVTQMDGVLMGGPMPQQVAPQARQIVVADSAVQPQHHPKEGSTQDSKAMKREF